MADETVKHWTPTPVAKIVDDTQVDVPPTEPVDQPVVEKAQQLPVLTGLWVKLNGDGRIAKILGFGSPPPFDYAGVIAKPSNVALDPTTGRVDFTSRSMAVVPLVNGTFIVLPKDADLIALINEAELAAEAAAKARAEAASY